MFSLFTSKADTSIGKSKVATVDAIQAHGGVDFELHLFLILSLLGGEWSTKVPRK